MIRWFGVSNLTSMEVTCSLLPIYSWTEISRHESRPWNADESSVSGNCYGGHAVAIENTTLKKTDDGVCWHCFCGSVFEDSMESDCEKNYFE
ncbi:hypothetical protein OUZ56_028727 [Daphnia magna]|uniref:Uncharacterized protein n=1 Tax=Daphnia magna TaxID=35525 RepID=A0ABR0B4Q5_9CRUS|nr:hypothetical protein OUZ56_028727 [Daphnia magna]